MIAKVTIIVIKANDDDNESNNNNVFTKNAISKLNDTCKSKHVSWLVVQMPF